MTKINTPKKNRKILFILHLPPPVHGSSMVGQSIKDSTHINQKFKTRYINLLASKNVGDSGKVNWDKISHFISIWFGLLKELITHKPEICYLALTVTGPAFFRDILLVILLKMFGIQRVYHLHNKGIKNHRKNKLYNFFYSFIFKDSDVIILSKHLYDDISDYVSKKDVHVCPNGIPSGGYVKSKTRNNLVSLLFLSNLFESKGVLVLMEACKKLNQKGLRFRCTFVGGEGDVSRSRINQLIIKNNLKDNVNYAGKKYGAEKEKEFSKADIFVFPTYYPKECFPLVLLEAMKFSLPIVTTSEGGIKDIVKNNVNGFIVSKKDPIALADKLETLLTDSVKRKKMGGMSRKIFEKKYTLDKFEKRITNIFDEIFDRI